MFRAMSGFSYEKMLRMKSYKQEILVNVTANV